jgi:hypothetical protein
MATLLRPYTTVADVQRETKNSGSELDDWYQECINLASRYIEDRCKRDFWFHDHTSTPLKVNRRRVMEDRAILPYPIVTLTEVRVFSDIDDPDDGNDVWDTDEYFFEEGERTIHAEAENDWKFSGAPGRFGSYPFRGFLWVKGTFGYPLETESGADPDTTPPPTLPAGVRRAATLIASAISDELHKEQVGLDGVRVELLDTRIPKEATYLLERYRDLIETQF